MKLLIEIDLGKVPRDTRTGAIDAELAAKLVEAAAERVRRLDTADLVGCSYVLRDENGTAAGSVTIRGDDGG